MSCNAGPSAVTNSAVLLLDANSGKNEPSGLMWTDQSNNLNVGTFVNSRNLKGSVFFSGGNLSFPITSGVQFTGDFTVECWFYGNSFASSGLFGLPHNASNFASVLVFLGSTNTVYLYSSNDAASWNIASAVSFGTLQINKWHHVAISRQGSSLRAFLDGVLGSTVTTSASLWNAGYDRCWIGDTAGNTNFNGYISNFRVVNGTALYTANFTPSTTLDAVSGTTLLTCKTGAIDLSSIANPITPSGSLAIQTNGSILLNGMNSYVNFATSPSLQFLGNSSYTLEAWVYPTVNPGANNWTGIFDRESTIASGRDGYNLYFLGSATTATYFVSDRWTAGTGVFPTVSVDQSLSVNNWNHIVVTYNGTNVSIYRNSVLGTTVASPGAISNTVQNLKIGRRDINYFTGKIAVSNVYNRALSQAEITQNFNALRSRFGI